MISPLLVMSSSTLTAIIYKWWFDPLIASLSFFVSIMIYTHHELKEKKSSYSTFSEFLWSKGVDANDKRPSLTMSLIAYWIGVWLWVNIVPPPHVSSSWDDNGVWTMSMMNYSSLSSSLSSPFYNYNIIYSISYLLLEVSSGIFLYDTIFFFLHLSMHECKFFALITNHKEHHKSSPSKNYLEARHVLRHSFMDGMLQVIVNILVQRYTIWGKVKSKLARVLHNVIVTMMLTESHSASDYPNFFKWWCVGVREHRNHHLLASSSSSNSSSSHFFSSSSSHHYNVNDKEGKKKTLRSKVHLNQYQQFFGHWDFLWNLYINKRNNNERRKT